MGETIRPSIGKMNNDFPDFDKEAVYIIHAKSGYEVHENRIREIFPFLGLSYQFMTEGDPTLMSKELKNKYFTANIENKLKPGVLSCTLNHILVYEDIVHKKYKWALVFENDPFFIADFKSVFAKILLEANAIPLGFMVSLENSTLKFPSYWQTQKGKYLYRAKSGRMAGAYLIDFEGAKRALEDLKIKKCGEVIDWWHNDLIQRGVLDMYWAQPYLTEQGSHNGQLHAGISSKSKGWMRKTSWFFQKNFKYYLGRFFNQSNIDSSDKRNGPQKDHIEK